MVGEEEEEDLKLVLLLLVVAVATTKASSLGIRGFATTDETVLMLRRKRIFSASETIVDSRLVEERTSSAGKNLSLRRSKVSIEDISIFDEHNKFLMIFVVWLMIENENEKKKVEKSTWY